VGYPGTALPYPIDTPTVPCTDAYEPDNYSFMAQPIVVNAAAQSHTFSTPGDHDWVTFNAIGGTTYVMQTSNLTGGAQTDLLLQGPTGALITRATHGANGSASLTWTAAENGAVKLLVQDPLGAPYGCAVGYNVQVTTSP